MADKVEKRKKRKRQEEKSAKPSKRVAFEGDKPIEFSILETGQWAPVIASTPGMAMPTEINLKTFTKPRRNAPSRISKSGDIATKELILHSSEHPKLDFTGREEEAGGTDALLKHYVGVYDPETGKLEVIEARKMVVRGSVRAHQATQEEEMSMNMRERRNVLGQTFGTKKARKAIASVTENAISPDKSLRSVPNGPATKLDGNAAAIIANMAEATKGMTSRDDLAKAADDAKPRPKANLNATVVEEVYTAESLIGEEILKLIPVRTWQDSIKKSKEIFVTSLYVAQRLQSTRHDNVEKLKILKFMALLLDCYNKSSSVRGGRRWPSPKDIKESSADMPEAVIEGAKRKFTTAGVISKYQGDLLITHVCAMACIVDHYEVDMWDLQQDLKLEAKLMAQYFSEIGARVTALSDLLKKKQGLDRMTASQRKMAKLKLPLDFPKLSFGRRK